ncbi:Ig-like domain-containing protein [Pedobacter sp. ISL-68]|uniref:glucoamylase family protein n=1 Tax=unclassified Pedobacter TaxID=2628915 RepID=UPI001BE82877|nr:MULTISPECIES: glucoamylase family protein [unclassified Pedobacter]MBT2563468.1 Ig-like domain-containing protein [Pedobacter sp. ISL-64]MBT2592912.1 Ig-like domain-containing protein [Pedobacter sp. ISL-68]
MKKKYFYIFILSAIFFGCKKGDTPAPVDPPVTPSSFAFSDLKVNDAYSGFTYYGLNNNPIIKITFSSPINSASISGNVTLTDASGNPAAFTSKLENNDNTVVITATALQPITKYILNVNNNLSSKTGGKLQSAVAVNLITAVDDADKFARISDDDLLTLVQKQTFKYFWDFAHPTSGLARERNTSGNTVTSGGSGFGIMALVTGISRNFISRADGLTRIQKMVSFLKTADRFHGAYPHWLDGNTGKAIPFSTKDNGGDLVETSFLMAGLITARQYFNGTDAAETALRADINNIYNGVEWAWYRKDNSNTLYWHWSPNYNWDMNLPIKGWNECLITYVMAAASPTYSIPKTVYDNGWAQNGAMKNGNTYYSVQLPLGTANGGPLFFAHYSFLGINPTGLSDAYANYETQTKAHTQINYNYCKANPLGNYGYGENCWGLTASDIPNGYTASAPNNDIGVIAPTAALSSFPYTPTESMQALKYFYYKLGNKTWGDYGFYDAFSLKDQWFASSTLAIDQGPIVVMIENYRTKLIWNLFMSAPEVKTGMKNLGFNSPNL